MMVASIEVILAAGVHCRALPLRTARLKPKTERLQSHIHSEPPRVPVNSYHCTLLGLRAKALPRVSQGQDIWALI